MSTEWSGDWPVSPRWRSGMISKTTSELKQERVRCIWFLEVDVNLNLLKHICLGTTALQQYWVGGTFIPAENPTEESHWEWTRIDPDDPSSFLKFNDFVNSKFDENTEPRSTESRTVIYMQSRNKALLSYASKTEQKRYICEVSDPSFPDISCSQHRKIDRSLPSESVRS
jgi:hypothetical protein